MMGEISLFWEKKDTSEVIITIFIFIVEFFMLLIFCEIIEINICGLKYNTKKNIEKRAEKTVVNENDRSESDYSIIELTTESKGGSFNIIKEDK